MELLAPCFKKKKVVGGADSEKCTKGEDDSVQDLSDIVSSLNGGQYFAVLLQNILTPQECQQLIERSEEAGYERALVNVGNGKQIVVDGYRDHDRCLMDDPHYAEMLYQRILLKLEQANPQLLGSMVNWKNRNGWYAVGLNERLRVLRYDPGCYFKPHRDGYYVRSNEAGPSRRGEKSQVTLLLYLNQDYQGGNTRMLEHGFRTTEGHDIVPRTGSVLLFEHRCLHEGATLEVGRKYVVRTDLMYTDKGPGHEYSKGLNRDETKADNSMAM